MFEPPPLACSQFERDACLSCTLVFYYLSLSNRRALCLTRSHLPSDGFLTTLTCPSQLELALFRILCYTADTKAVLAAMKKALKAREDDLEATKTACTKVDNEMRWVYFVFRLVFCLCDWMKVLFFSSLIGLISKKLSYLCLVSYDAPTDPSRRRRKRPRKERTMLKRLLGCTSTRRMPLTISATPEETEAT